jgi:hypothetical protein
MISCSIIRFDSPESFDFSILLRHDVVQLVVRSSSGVDPGILPEGELRWEARGAL